MGLGGCVLHPSECGTIHLLPSFPPLHREKIVFQSLDPPDPVLRTYNGASEALGSSHFEAVGCIQPCFLVMQSRKGKVKSQKDKLRSLSGPGGLQHGARSPDPYIRGNGQETPRGHPPHFNYLKLHTWITTVRSLAEMPSSRSKDPLRLWIHHQLLTRSFGPW